VGTKVGDLLAAVAASARPEVPELCRALVEQMLRDIPQLVADKPLEDLLKASVTANVMAALDTLASGPDPDLEAPAAAVEYARRLAQRGIPISALLRAYRLGQAGFQQRMLLGVAAETQQPDVLVEASVQLSTLAFFYVDRISEQVVAAYQSERDRWLRNRTAVRAARVMSVLANGAADIGDAEKSLGYPLRQIHRGAVVWVDGRTQDADRLSRLEQVVGKLADQLGSERAPLVIAPDDSTVWAWLPVPSRPPEPSDRKPVETDGGTWIALGDPAPGVDGFRLSHRQARQAQVVAMAADPDRRAIVTESAQAGLVALMCTDLESVGVWVQHTLGPLAVDDEASARLRETVRAFLAAGGSYTAAAQELILHKNTVHYRIRKAEEARGRPLSDGRLDVEVALLAIHLLGSTLLQAPSR
jgi:DNA-binding PucR family transcriptional regulator